MKKLFLMMMLVMGLSLTSLANVSDSGVSKMFTPKSTFKIGVVSCTFHGNITGTPSHSTTASITISDAGSQSDSTSAVITSGVGTWSATHSWTLPLTGDLTMFVSAPPYVPYARSPKKYDDEFCQSDINLSA